MADLEVLREEECREILSTQRLCVLSISDDGEPYAVPMFYGFDGETMYIGVSEGRKTRVLDANPRVCVIVTDVPHGQSWRSVNLSGRAEWVTDAAGRARAIEVLMEHNRRSRERLGESAPAAGGAARSHQGSGRMMRIVDVRLSGRARR